MVTRFATLSSRERRPSLTSARWLEKNRLRRDVGKPRISDSKQEIVDSRTNRPFTQDWVQVSARVVGHDQPEPHECLMRCWIHACPSPSRRPPSGYASATVGLTYSCTRREVRPFQGGSSRVSFLYVRNRRPSPRKREARRVGSASAACIVSPAHGPTPRRSQVLVRKEEQQE